LRRKPILERKEKNRMRIKVHLSIGYANADQEDKIEVSEEEMAGMDDEERGKYLDSLVEDWASDYIDYGYEVIEE
jgi:predicted solute-binding protein